MTTTMRVKLRLPIEVDVTAQLVEAGDDGMGIEVLGLQIVGIPSIFVPSNEFDYRFPSLMDPEGVAKVLMETPVPGEHRSYYMALAVQCAQDAGHVVHYARQKEGRWVLACGADAKNQLFVPGGYEFNHGLTKEQRCPGCQKKIAEVLDEARGLSEL